MIKPTKSTTVKGKRITPGAIGYLDRLSARPGETLTLKVSVLDGGGRYSASLVRLLCGDTGPKGPKQREEHIPSAIDGEHAGFEQRTDCGSYAIVEGLPDLSAVAFEILVKPTLPGGLSQVIMALGPVRLVLDAQGAATLEVGEVAISTGVPLRRGQWYRVEAAYDPETGKARVASTPLPGIHADKPAEVDSAGLTGIKPKGPLLFAAERGPDGFSKRHFNGKLEAPRLVSANLVTQWDFSDGIGTAQIRDRFRHGMHGRTVNAPKRAVVGSAWDGTVHDWRQKPAHYAAIHFHPDDLYDANWQSRLTVPLPDNLKSGFYAIRLKTAEGPVFHVGFVVRPKADGSKRPGVAILASTLTYLAYSNYRRRMSPGPFELSMGALPTVDAIDVLLAEHPELGASTYDVHPDGTGVSMVSIHRPLFNMRPTGRFWNFSMDLCLVDWLEAEGIAYDVISDHDLHAEGADALAPYRVVMTGCHPEYHTTETLDAIQGFLGRGGRFMYMGGNGFYWRLVYDPDYPGAVELRRAEDGTRAWAEMPGEYYHMTGDYGGLWRRIGRPPNLMFGIGFVAQGFDNSSYYRRTAAAADPRAAFLFDGVAGEIIGDFGAWGDGAAGLELDGFDLGLGSPPHGLVVASSENHSNAFLMVNEELLSNRHGVDGTQNPLIRADMVFFETPSGGAVFSTGSIAYVASLAHNNYDNQIARLTGNCLRRFLDPTPFKLPQP